MIDLVKILQPEKNREHRMWKREEKILKYGQ